MGKDWIYKSFSDMDQELGTNYYYKVVGRWAE